MRRGRVNRRQHAIVVDLAVLVEETVPLADVAKAHELVEDGHVTGKVVLIS